MRVQILVASHKKYWMPNDQVYSPIQVGASGRKSLDYCWLRDDVGENISEKNYSFCELTGMYWAWKHMDADVYGLCHYRRYMGNRKVWRLKKKRILSRKEIDQMLRGHDLILPRKRFYWIETRESQYAHAHHIEDLKCTEKILEEKYPEYLPAWDKMLKSRSGHICNMFVMRKELFDSYCGWLFDILFEAERRLDITGYSEKDKRVFGYLGERLLDVWIKKNELSYVEVPMINIERQHWFRKGIAFLQRKFSKDKDEMVLFISRK